MTETYDITLYAPGQSSMTYRGRDAAFLKRAKAVAKERGLKITVSKPGFKGNGRYR